MAAKKNVWLVKLYLEMGTFNANIEVQESKVGLTDNGRWFKNKREAIATAVATARILYYNTVLGTNIPLDTRIFATYQFNKNPRIEIKTKEWKVTPVLITPPLGTRSFTLDLPSEVVDVDRSKKEAEALLDKITARYAKYIEDEDYWQELFKEQARET